MSQTHHIGWVFTLNNYTYDEVMLLRSVDCAYLVYGKEEAYTTGTPHLQGYIEFNKPVSRKSVRRLLSNRRIWIQFRKSTRERAIAYCKKEYRWVEFCYRNSSKEILPMPIMEYFEHEEGPPVELSLPKRRELNGGGAPPLATSLAKLLSSKIL